MRPLRTNWHHARAKPANVPTLKSRPSDVSSPPAVKPNSDELRPSAPSARRAAPGGLAMGEAKSSTTLGWEPRGEEWPLFWRENTCAATSSAAASPPSESHSADAGQTSEHQLQLLNPKPQHATSGSKQYLWLDWTKSDHATPISRRTA